MEQKKTTPSVSGLVPHETKLPTLSDIFGEDASSLELAAGAESLNAILNVEPPQKWIKKNPYADNSLYIPIDKVEYLMRKIFKKWRVKITGQGTSFNGVWVTVRVRYYDPSLAEWTYQDGIGAAQLQTKKGTSPADLANINNGAIAMAFPIAKTEAIKDACHLIGNIFGANLNRKDTLAFSPDTEIIDRYKKSLANEEEKKKVQN